VRRHYGVLDIPATIEEPGPPIVIAPGWGEGLWGWRRSARAIAELTGSRVVVISAPGWSNVWFMVGGEMLRRNAHHTLSQMERLGIDGAVGLGHSLAGIYLPMAATMSPMRFSRLILICPSGFMGPESFWTLVGRLLKKTWLSIVYAIPRPRLWAPTLMALLEGAIYPLRNPSALREGYEAAKLQTALPDGVPTQIALARGDVLNIPGRISAPPAVKVTIIEGPHDPQYDAIGFSKLIGDLLLA